MMVEPRALLSQPPRSSHDPIHVVTGAGPVGSTVALQLAERGQQVRLLTRSGSGPEHPLIERRRVDVSRPDAARPRPSRARSPSTTASTARRTTPAPGAPSCRRRAGRPRGRRSGRCRGGLPREPLLLRAGRRPDDRGPAARRHDRQARRPHRAARPARRVRRRRRSASRRPTSTARGCASPTPASGSCRPCWPGRTMRVIGSLDQPHSFTYVPDLAAAMIRAAATPDLWDSFLHAPTAPPVTQRQADRAGRRRPPACRAEMSAIPVWVERDRAWSRGDPRAGGDRLHVRPGRSSSTRARARSGSASPPPRCDGVPGPWSGGAPRRRGRLTSRGPPGDRPTDR